MNKTNNNKRKHRPNNLKESSSGAGSVWHIPKWLGFPDQLRTDLRYIIPLSQLTGGGTTNSFKFTSNAYDVDSALGSTAMAGFSELAAVYSRFRTLGVKYHFQIENQEAFPVQTIYGGMTTSLGSTAVGANYAGNKYMHTNVLSAINGSRSTSTYTGSVRMNYLFGSNQALYDDLFTGSTTSNTLSSSATGYFYIGTVAATTPVNGQFVGGWIELDVLFTRKNAIIV